MPFKRKLELSFPCVYDTWRTGDSMWVIQDLPPEDDEEALKILVDHLITDESLCSAQKLIEDPLSVQEICAFWRDCLAQRMTLACYEEKDGVRTLAGLNVCIVESKGEEAPHYEFKGDKWRYVYEAVIYTEKKSSCYDYLGIDTVLFAMGLVVKREYRGAGLGQRILNAREPLALAQDIKGTATVFTGIASQIPAAKCGFVTIAEVTMKEYADAGLPYPADDKHIIKYMVKKFVD